MMEYLYLQVTGCGYSSFYVGNGNGSFYFIPSAPGWASYYTSLSYTHPVS